MTRHFVPYDDLGETPNIVVDGAGNPATEITLSHWPKSGTHKDLKADTSAEIVFNYLDSPAFHVAAEAVTNNHFDEDGLVGVFTLIEPEAACAMRELLCDAARAGDFATYRGAHRLHGLGLRRRRPVNPRRRHLRPALRREMRRALPRAFAPLPRHCRPYGPLRGDVAR